MNRRRLLKYDFLQVSDELLDERAPALARLLSASGKRVTPGDALRLVARLDRYVLRRVDDLAPDVLAEIRACAVLPTTRAGAMLALATDWPESKAAPLLEALADPEVRVLEPHPEGWQVRGVAERYGRFAAERRASRERTRDNNRARSAGWRPGEGHTWTHCVTGEVLGSLKEVIARLEKAQ
jgi:hypothetical protein